MMAKNGKKGTEIGLNRPDIEDNGLKWTNDDKKWAEMARNRPEMGQNGTDTNFLSIFCDKLMLK